MKSAIVVTSLAWLCCLTAVMKAAPKVESDTTPIGQDEGANLEKWIFPASYRFPRKKALHVGIILPHPLKKIEKINFGQPSPGGREFLFELSLHFPAGDIRRTSKGQIMSAQDGDLIPYFDHVYRVNYQGDDVILTDMTKQVPPKMVPAATSRTVVLRETLTSLFRNWDSGPAQGTQQEFEWIDLEEIDDEWERAKLYRIPATHTYTPNDQGGWTYQQTSSEPSRQWVKVGDVLPIGGRAVLVKQIVAPRPIPNVGRPVGWIEFSLADKSEDEEN
ncbi:hypothetical protein DTL42_25880 [Bremerella cremea]|uniref:Uncharacterized protein n=1 Tax=Bremerella cremea TaxID=1031537 RepID=A0A368KJN9_9BACT|nr:hypothetical protein [Bremerella cremea]RCS40791.1 hypothetical protein DTL42_25880 [Bremerella cremea]